MKINHCGGDDNRAVFNIRYETQLNHHLTVRSIKTKHQPTTEAFLQCLCNHTKHQKTANGKYWVQTPSIQIMFHTSVSRKEWRWAEIRWDVCDVYWRQPGAEETSCWRQQTWCHVRSNSAWQSITLFNWWDGGKKMQRKKNHTSAVCARVHIWGVLFSYAVSQTVSVRPH